MRSARRCTEPLARPPFGAGAALLLLLLAGCAVPLGPGFGIERQEVAFAYGGGDVAGVWAVYRLRNEGNEPLERLQINLPHGLANFRATIDGRPADPLLAESYVEDAPAAPQRAEATFTFSPPLAMKRRFQLVLEYDVPVRAQHPVAAADAAAVYLPAESWFPEMVPPAAMFARGRGRHPETRLVVRLPEGWRVLTPGRAERPRARGGAAEHRIRLRGSDGAPYLLAGRYHEHTVSARGQTVVFWMFAPLDAAAVQPAGARIAEDLAALETILGPRRKRQGEQTWVVELLDSRYLEGKAFEEGLILWPQRMADLVAGATPSPHHRDTLAGIWFEQLSRPEGQTAQMLADGLKHIVLTRFGELDREETRAAHIAAKLEAFDRFSSDSELQVAANEKMRAFAFALEDRLGRETLHAGLRRMVQARRGDTWNRNDLRAALELESGQDLAEIFRRWLDEPGIPEDFRARYAPPGRK
jgi:hypothetical protein